jgi:hypothetical protein
MVIRFVNTLLSVNGPADSARIYLLSDDERQVTPTGPAVIDADGVRQELPPLVFNAVQHVIEAMRAGMAVKVSPLRHELPIDEAARAIGMRPDMLRKYVAEGAIPFRSTEYVDWVQLEDVIAFDRERRRKRSEGVQKLLDEEPWDEPTNDGPPE